MKRQARIVLVVSSLLMSILLYPVGSQDPLFSTDTLFLYDSDGSPSYIIDVHDFRNDTANRSVILNGSEVPGEVSWTSWGAPSIWYNESDDTWFLTSRQRLGDGSRGKYLFVHKCVSADPLNPNNWEEVCRIDKDDVANDYVESWELSCLRYWNNSFYLYFCFDSSAVAGDWDTSFVRVQDIDDLNATMSNGNNYHLIDTGFQIKDPKTYFDNNYYYINYHNTLYKDDNPEFTNPTLVEAFYSDVASQWHNLDQFNNGGIVKDNTTGKYIHFNAYTDAGSTNKVYMYYWVGDSLNDTSWTMVQKTYIKDATLSTPNNDFRYWDVAQNSTHLILVGEWDIWDADYKSTILWDYEIGSVSSDTELAITSINSQANNTVLYTDSTYLTWMRDPNATSYALIVDNTSSFANPFINLSNITISSGWCTNTWINTSASDSPYSYNYYENETICTLYLPYSLNITYNIRHYYIYGSYALH